MVRCVGGRKSERNGGCDGVKKDGGCLNGRTFDQDVCRRNTMSSRNRLNWRVVMTKGEE